MARNQQAGSNVGAAPAWGFDDTTGDFLPGIGDVAYDKARSVGNLLTSRALVNNFLPSGLAIVQTANGTETNTYTTRVAIHGTLVNAFNFPGTLVAGTFPAGVLSLVGRTLRIRASGTLGATSTPNLTVDIGLGAGILATTGALAMATATSPAPWFLDVQATVQTAGASGVVISEGFFLYSTTSSVVVVPWTMGNSTRGTGLSADLTTALALSLNATCGTSNAANRIICNTLSCEILF
jgi:hypothetical protein